VAVSAPGAVLALRALGLGDLVTSVPALRALRRSFPDRRLLLACPRPLHGLVRLWRLADEPVDARPLERVPLEPTERVEVAVNLHGRGPQSTVRLLETRPGRLVAFAHDAVPSTAELPAWDAEEHEVVRWCRLLAECGIPADPDALELPVRGGDASSGAVVVHPGAAAPARRWPASRWAAVARVLRDEGHEVVLTGSRAERPLCARVAGAAGLSAESVLAGDTSLVELAALVGRARAVLCGDTGVAHLATALAIPSVVVFGPTSPARWGPRPARDRHRVLWAGTTGDPHGERPDPGLLEIGVAHVVLAAREVLD
jgi:ADP-heptose:LPS heptosyltransferase